MSEFQLKNPTVLISRQISFCCGLRLRCLRWDEAEHQRVYGKRMRSHGANFRLRVALDGQVSKENGMIVNIVEIKPRLASIIEPLDGRFLNQDVEFFGQHSPTPENVALYLWNQMPDKIGDGRLCRLELDQLSHTSVEICRSHSCYIMKVSRSYEFAAAHRLFVPAFSEQENWRRFDRCSNPAGHGHNFRLQVWVEGQPDEESGFIINPNLLDAIVEAEVYQRFDHRHLNEDCPEFSAQGLVPTSENLSIVIFDLLNKRLNKEGHKLVRIGLRETEKNYFEVEA